MHPWPRPSIPNIEERADHLDSGGRLRYAPTPLAQVVPQGITLVEGPLDTLHIALSTKPSRYHSTWSPGGRGPLTRRRSARFQPWPSRSIHESVSRDFGS